MRQKTKKLLSVVLSLSMAFSVMPLAYAEEPAGSGTEVAEPVILADAQGQNTTTSGASFEINTTGAANAVTITFGEPQNDGTSNSVFDLELSNGGLTYDDVLDAAVEKGTVEATIPVSRIADGNGMTFDALLAQFTFDASAVAAMKDSSDVVTLTVGTVDPEYNSAYAIDLSLVDANEDPLFNNLNGNGEVEVTVPVGHKFTSIQLLQAANSGVEVYYQPNASTAERIAGADFDAGTNAVTFTTKHFSPYNILISQGLNPVPVAIDVEAGENATLTVTSDAGTDADSIASYNAVSSDTDIATVTNHNDGTFTVEGKAKGLATLTISATGQKGFGNPESITVTVNVKEADKKIDQRILMKQIP